MIFTTINTTGNEEHYYSVYKAVTYLEAIRVHCYRELCDTRKTSSMMYVKRSESKICRDIKSIVQPFLYLVLVFSYMFVLERLDTLLDAFCTIYLLT